jgi:hypothetical protein
VSRRKDLTTSEQSTLSTSFGQDESIARGTEDPEARFQDGVALDSSFKGTFE